MTAKGVALGKIEDWFDGLAGSAIVSRAGVAATSRRLRILAYHDVSDQVRFHQQMTTLVRHFRPVSLPDIVAAVETGRELPPRSVWITFDDGDPTVIGLALPVLTDLGLPTTLFLCPGVIDTHQPFWWQVAEIALAHGLVVPQVPPESDTVTVLSTLKAMPDATRRSVISQVTNDLIRAGVSTERRQLTTAELESYVSQGGTLGNHTWDHPCLDMCPPSEQERQVSAAHDWLMSRFDVHPKVFAYPNGNHALHAEAVLTGLGYRLAVLFDHRLADVTAQHTMRLSRLRTNSELTPGRFQAILSGIHPLVHRLRR